MRDLLLVSPTAGNGRCLSRLPRLLDEMTSAGIDVTVEVTTSLRHAHRLARDTRSSSVLVSGGDGLVGCVAGALAHGDKTLGIIPTGRGNDFARSLGITRTNAVDKITARRAVSVDLGRLDDAYFTCVASTGLDSRVVERSSRIPLRGRLVYPVATLIELAGWKKARFEVEVDGVGETFEGYNVAVANGSYYGGGMRIAPDADVTDGLLDLVVVVDAAKTTFLRHAPKVFRGTHVDSPLVITRRVERVVFDGPDETVMVADGEVRTGSTDVSVAPSALRVYR